MNLKELYTQYGELMVQFELLQSQISQVKKKIADALNDANKPKQEEAKNGGSDQQKD